MNFNCSSGEPVIFVAELSNFQAIAISTLILTLYCYFTYIYKTLGNLKNSKPPIQPLTVPVPIPVIPGSLPIIGHGFYFLWGFKEFIEDCCKKYGGIFQIQVFRRTLIVISDQTLVREYFKQKEDKLSLTKAMKNLNYDWTFYGGPTDLHVGLQYMRKSCSVLPRDVIPKIECQTLEWIQKLKRECQNSVDGKFKIDLESQVFRSIAKTSFYALTSLNLEENTMEDLESFFKVLNGAIISSYFMPTWLTQLFFNWKLQPMRETLVKQIEFKLQQDAEECSTSTLVKNANRYQENQEPFSSSAAACFLISFLYVSGANTSPALAHTVLLLAMPENSQVLEELRQECQNSINDLENLLKSPMLNACIIEMARLCSNIFTNVRTPKDTIDTLGNYAINQKNVDIVISGQMLAAVNGNFENPAKFYPRRFLNENLEFVDGVAKNIILWGGGLHECPGKKFALLELKIALAHLILNFDFKIIGKVPQLDYFVPAFFAKRAVEMIVTERHVQN